MNLVMLIGRLTRDPELKYLQGSGTPVANFSVAVDREFAGKDGKKEVDFIDIQVWGKSAENCTNYISKGSKVAIQGSLRIDTYQNQAGENRKITRVNAVRVQFLDNKKNNNNDKAFETLQFQEVPDGDMPF
ncbi:single-stranded DNA-binding protein [Romboutsia timonensis]|uniref:single-stranded DNA-binding protein n=1 Tax=Romboutsia timonensis TaxID=1776391 RepID=UPI002A7ED6B3|nr:single-stranded DNA-binding protein [Romboutsia timonensis]MDY3960946.1 single-stranded DNA-binding protein [Romboutsia timonensis]